MSFPLSLMEEFCLPKLQVRKWLPILILCCSWPLSMVMCFVVGVYNVPHAFSPSWCLLPIPWVCVILGLLCSWVCKTECLSCLHWIYIVRGQEVTTWYGVCTVQASSCIIHHWPETGSSHELLVYTLGNLAGWPCTLFIFYSSCT